MVLSKISIFIYLQPIVSFFAIIPLAKVSFCSIQSVDLTNVTQLLAFATDELSIRVGQTLAGLLNATLVSVLLPL